MCKRIDVFVVAPIGALTAALALTSCSLSSTSDQDPCSNMTAPLTQQVDPRDQSSIATTSAKEALAAVKRGYIEHLSTSVEVSTDARGTLVPLHRLYRKSTNDYLWSADQKEIIAALDHGYIDQGPGFYASTEGSECMVGVHRYRFKNQHRLVVSAAERQRLEQAGWRDEGVKFYGAKSRAHFDPAAPKRVASSPTIFTFAVLPPTEQEVLRAGDLRFEDRSVWLVRKQSELNLKFVTHSGDVVDWDTADHVQYRRARQGLKPLEAAGIPYSLALGNHDTAAACPEEDTCNGPDSKKAVRDTRTANKFFTTQQFGGIKGQFEKAKVDNAYAMYNAGGLRWLVLTLEMSPRPAAVKWAAGVVAKNPRSNVIVVTHTYLSSSGEIDPYPAIYGDTSPRYLYDNLIAKYPNVRLVFSSHVGGTTDRVDTGVHGNKIYSFLHHVHDPKSNPLRLVEVDSAGGTLKTYIYAPNTDRIIGAPPKTISKINWVR